MINILVLDPYRSVQHRIAKDMAGAYGTSNQYGDNFFCKILNFLVRYSDSSPPLFAAQIIGELHSFGHNVEYEQNIPKKNYDLYIIISSIVCHETEIEVIKKLKLDKKNVIAVGSFATAVPQKYIEAGAKVVSGEPDMFFHNFNYKKEDLEKLPDLINNFKTIDLNELSLPGWEIIFKYTKPKMKFLGPGNAIYIQSSRGCPYPCFFYCTYPTQQGRKLRFRDSSKILEEMNYFNKKLDVKNFIFRDPVFAISKEHTMELCKKLISNKVKYNICIETHLNNIDEELALYLKKAGVKIAMIGIESGVEEIRKISHRLSETNDKQLNKINFLEKIGIKIKANYIIGLPEDNEETYYRTLNYAKLINSSYAQFSIFTPYPGTPAYLEYQDKIITNKFEDFTQFQLIFNHKNFSPKKINKLLSESYTNYYLSPKWIIKFLKNKILFN